MSEKFDPKKYMTQLDGRDYLPVPARVMWFKSDHPDGRIITEIVSIDPIVVKASVIIDGVVVATGHGSAEPRPNPKTGKLPIWEARRVEKAETAAIGRALANAGYGTLFTGMDDSEHLADTPITRPNPSTEISIMKVKMPDAPVEGERTVNKVSVRQYTKKSGDAGAYIQLWSADEHIANVFTRKLFTDAGYDTSAWLPGADVTLEKPALVRIEQANGRAEVVSVLKTNPF